MILFFMFLIIYFINYSILFYFNIFFFIVNIRLLETLGIAEEICTTIFYWNKIRDLRSQNNFYLILSYFIFPYDTKTLKYIQYNIFIYFNSSQISVLNQIYRSLSLLFFLNILIIYVPIISIYISWISVMIH